MEKTLQINNNLYLFNLLYNKIKKKNNLWNKEIKELILHIRKYSQKI